MEEDEEWYKPGKFGIVVSVQVTSAGEARLQVGDVQRQGAHGWKDEAPVTFKDLDRAAFSDVDLDEGVLSDLGLLVVARLAARFLGNNT